MYQADDGVYKSYDKFHGRTLDEHSFKDMLYEFLHNGKRFRSELLQPIVHELKRLIMKLDRLSSYRFYASSLLIIYDGTFDKFSFGEKSSTKNSSPSKLSSSTGKQKNSSDSFQTSQQDRLESESQNIPEKCSFLESYSLQQTRSSSAGICDHSIVCDKLTNTISSEMCKTNDNCKSLVTDSTEGCYLSDTVSLTDKGHYSSCLEKEAQNLHTNDLHSVVISSSASEKNIIASATCDTRGQLTETSSNKKRPLNEQVSITNENVQKTNMSTTNSCQTNQENFVDSVYDKSTGVKFDIKMIDFAHTTHSGFTHDVKKHSGPDQDYINGLKNLVKLFEKLLTESLNN